MCIVILPWWCQYPIVDRWWRAGVTLFSSRYSDYDDLLPMIGRTLVLRMTPIIIVCELILMMCRIRAEWYWPTIDWTGATMLILRYIVWTWPDSNCRQALYWPVTMLTVLMTAVGVHWQLTWYAGKQAKLPVIRQCDIKYVQQCHYSVPIVIRACRATPWVLMTCRQTVIKSIDITNMVYY